MKFITNKNSVIRKILIIILIALVLIIAITPNYSVYADTEVIAEDDLPDEGNGFGGTLLKVIVQLVDALADVVMGALNQFMLGTDAGSEMLDQKNQNIGNPDSWLYVNDNDEVDYEYKDGTIDPTAIVGGEYKIPNFLYSPEAIFSNNIAALDVNFLNPNTYSSVINSSENAEKASKSAASGVLGQTIADWYISFRNVAIVGLLSVLIYLGIRIVISSTAVDKAKYKEYLQNWVVALCLVFFMHFIMSGLLMITDEFNNLFAQDVNDNIVISIDNIKFKTNLIGYVRFNAQSKSTQTSTAYSILYVTLVIYTVIFTFMYFKRFLYMAFLTMIAPLVAITYPIDKVGDGKAQAFNTWFKEYITHLILQPVHLILYIALVSSAMNLVKDNLIYGLVAIAFLIPAEKLIKKMFNLEGAQTTSGFGSFAGGALTMSGLNKVASALGGGKSKRGSDKSGKSSNSDELPDGKIRTQDRSFLQSFNGDETKENDSAKDTENNYNTNDPTNSGMNNDQSDDEMEKDKEIWQSMVDDPNESEKNKKDAQAEIDEINARQQSNNSDDTEKDISTLNKPEKNKHWKRNVARQLKNKVISPKGLYTAGKVLQGAGKIAGGVVGAGMGATIGIAAGLATGDFGKVAQNMAAGATAGGIIGQAPANIAGKVGNNIYGMGRSVINQADKLKFEKDRAMYGTEYASKEADRRANERIKRKQMKDPQQQAKFEEMAERISKKTNTHVDAKELMERGFDYQVAGLDDKQMERGLTTEMKHKGDKNIHENMLDVTKMASSYGDDYIFDDKKRTSMQDKIKSKVKGEQQQDRIWNLYTDTLGYDKLDSKYNIKR